MLSSLANCIVFNDFIRLSDNVLWTVIAIGMCLDSSAIFTGKTKIFEGRLTPRKSVRDFYRKKNDSHEIAMKAIEIPAEGA